MRLKAIAKSILSATLIYTIITGDIALIIIVIQWIVGLLPADYNIASLNIFNKGNSILGVINLQTLIGAYAFGIMLFETNNFSEKSSVIWAVLYIIIFWGVRFNKRYFSIISKFKNKSLSLTNYKKQTFIENYKNLSIV